MTCSKWFSPGWPRPDSRLALAAEARAWAFSPVGSRPFARFQCARHRLSPDGFIDFRPMPAGQQEDRRHGLPE
jgi:hypothetical protein